jgi:hypothetical protein
MRMTRSVVMTVPVVGAMTMLVVGNRHGALLRS